MRGLLPIVIGSGGSLHAFPWSLTCQEIDLGKKPEKFRVALHHRAHTPILAGLQVDPIVTAKALAMGKITALKVRSPPFHSPSSTTALLNRPRKVYSSPA